MEVGKLGQVQENPSTFPQGLDLRPSPPLGAPCLLCRPLPTAMMEFPPWDLPCSQPSLGKALSAQDVCLAGVSGRSSPGSTHQPPRTQEGFFLRPLEMQRVSFWLGGVSATWASALRKICTGLGSGSPEILLSTSLSPGPAPYPAVTFRARRPFEDSWGRSVFHATCLSMEAFVLAVRHAAQTPRPSHSQTQTQTWFDSQIPKDPDTGTPGHTQAKTATSDS